MEHIIKKQADQDEKYIKIIAKKLENDYQLPPGSVKASLQDNGKYLFSDSNKRSLLKEDLNNVDEYREKMNLEDLDGSIAEDIRKSLGVPPKEKK